MRLQKALPWDGWALLVGAQFSKKKVRPRQVVESAHAELPYQVGSTPPWGNSIFKIDLFPDHRILAEMQRN